MHTSCCLSRLVSGIIGHVAEVFLPVLVSLDGGLQFILGKQESAQWNIGANPVLMYSYSDQSGQKNVEIELICNEDSNGELIALGEVDIGFYKFQLTSKCSCWDGCKDE